MGIKKFKPITNGTRNMSALDYKGVTTNVPEKSLTTLVLGTSPE